MREHDPGVERLQADLGDERAAPHRMPRVLEALLEDVDRRLGVLSEHAAGAPIVPCGCPRLVPVVLRCRVKWALRQLERDDVVLVGCEKHLALLGRDDVVGRGGHRRDVAFRPNVAIRGEGSDASHERVLLGTGGGRSDTATRGPRCWQV